MTINMLQYVISGISVLLALIHIIFPSITIDSITLGLVVIAVLPWLSPLFKTVELPGGLKVEFQELLNTQIKADEIGLLASSKEHPEIYEYSYQLFQKSDPNLALASLRIEIESRLRRIAHNKGIEINDQTGIEIMEKLVTKGTFKKNEGHVIQELLKLLDSAFHGAKVDSKAVEWVNDIGPRILYTLDNR